MAEEAVNIWIDDVKIVEGGLGVGDEAEKEATKRMRRNEFTLTVDLQLGEHEEQFLTCDLTHEYIKINAEYRT